MRKVPFLHYYKFKGSWGMKNQKNQYSPLGSFGVVLSWGGRARKALFYKALRVLTFCLGGGKKRHFLKKWCNKEGDVER